MSFFRKSVLRILLIPLSVLFLSFVFVIYVYLNVSKPFVCGVIDDTEFVCGNAQIDISEDLKIGKELFKGNCAACHNPKKDMYGPALAKIDSVTFFNWAKFDKSVKLQKDTIKYGFYYHILNSQSLAQDDFEKIYNYVHF